ncbi:MAG: alpha/beta hydrolase-fold protein [Lachnospiraceae bacterium]|nr:alpha/beta hydrolase-fold protein [Lachnospiraceae bacterium]MDD3616389.1 alpha/beta hydrolase-fold protein [Lachnospiraceae bacterium]
MAFIQMNLMSKALMRTVPVNVILPADKLIFTEATETETKPFKTLYLLHGVFGSSLDWVNGTRIQRFAEENDLAVVMPSGDNAFYVDQPKGNNYYGEFVGKELVELTRKMFHLSHKKEDTFIGGLSMGGYGALRNGLKYSDTFGAILALSAALIIEELPGRDNSKPLFIENRDYAENCFGDLDKLLESDKNPKYLVKQMIKEEKEFPKIYMACGDRDSLFGVNKDMAEFLQNSGLEVTFDVGPGRHEWDFWDTYIRKAIDWLPLRLAVDGINSGNVGI